jgi:hypothetical protein
MHTAVRCPLAMFPSQVINYICEATDVLAKELFAAYEHRVAEEERRVNAVRLTSPSYDPCEEVRAPPPPPPLHARPSLLIHLQALLELYAQADREREALVAGNGVPEASPEPPAADAAAAAAAKAKKPRKRASKADKEAVVTAAAKVSARALLMYLLAIFPIVPIFRAWRPSCWTMTAATWSRCSAVRTMMTSRCHPHRPPRRR